MAVRAWRYGHIHMQLPNHSPLVATGWSNAFTSDTDTVYFNTVDAGYLKGTLDRFAQFFIAPRMDPSCTERSVTNRTAT